MTTREHIKINFPSQVSANGALIKALIDPATLFGDCAFRVEAMAVVWEPATGKAITCRLTRAFGLSGGTVTAYGNLYSVVTGDASLTAMGFDLLVQTNKVSTSVQGLIGKTLNFVVWNEIYTSEL